MQMTNTQNSNTRHLLSEQTVAAIFTVPCYSTYDTTVSAQCYKFSVDGITACRGHKEIIQMFHDICIH